MVQLPLGYNHPELVNLTKSDGYCQSFINRLDTNEYYTTSLKKIVDKTISRISPKKLNKVIFTCGCGSSANELAIKLSMFRRGNVHQGNIRQMEVPDESQFTVLSFKNGFHGRIGGTLTLTRSKPIQKLGIPQFNWPMAPFPILRHPLNENNEYNSAEESRCLEETEKILQKNKTLSAMIVEAVQAEGGDFWATPSYYKQLRNLALKYNVDFIVDEVQTGMATGGYLVP